MSDRLVVATQVVDPEHPSLGATVAKLRSLAARVDELVVLADRAVPGVLPANCRVRVFAAARQEERAWRFLDALGRELRPRPLAVLAHMVPRYAVLAAPLARPARVPLLLWFTHWKASRTLALAERAATIVLSVERRSFPLPTHKLVATGHGVDTELFARVERRAGAELRALALGRTSPAKGFAAVARAAERAGVALEIVGPSSTPEERAERARLEALGARVRDPVPYPQVPALLAGADVLVDNMREGALDKIVYEAGATCLPVLASNRGFAALLPRELRFEHDDADGLAARLEALRGLDRAALGALLRRRVEAGHSVAHWADAVLEVARA